MKEKAIAIAAMVAVTAALGASAAEEASAPAGKPQTTCPVMGGRVSRSSGYVDAEGKRIYVCCRGCVAAVKADPAKYIQKLEADGVTVAKTQAACPVMGQPIDRKLYVDTDGKRIYVCCPACVAAVKADPVKYEKQLEGQGVALDPAR